MTTRTAVRNAFFDTTYTHRKFNKLYERVRDELSGLDIKSAVRYREVRNAGSYHEDHEALMAIEFGFARNVMSLYRSMEKRAKEASGISLAVDDLVPRLNHGQLAKAIAFSETTYMLRPELSLLDVSLRQDHGGIRIDHGPDLGGCLDLLYSHPEDVTSGYITPVPDDVNMLDLDKLLDRHFSAHPNPFLGIGQEARLPNLLQVKLTGQGLGYTDNYLQLGIVMPSLANLPLDTIRKIRRDNATHFVHFQDELRRFVEDLQGASDEKKLIGLLRKIETEVASLQSAFKRQKFARYGVAGLASLICLMLCIKLDPVRLDGLRSTLEGILGGAGLLTLTGSGKPVEESPYFLPLKLHWESTKQVRKSLRS